MKTKIQRKEKARNISRERYCKRREILQQYYIQKSLLPIIIKKNGNAYEGETELTVEAEVPTHN